MEPFENLISQLAAKSNTDNIDILNAVNRKYSEMKGLITKEGAVYLIAKDMDIQLPENHRSDVQIRNVTVGMKNINVIGRIFRISKITEFKKSNGSPGRVTNIFIGDVTGYVRIPFWDEQVKLIEDHILNLGDAVQITNAFAKENNFSEVELSIGKFGGVNAIEDFVELPSVDELSKMFLKIFPERTTISNIIPGGNFEIRGIIANVFEGNFLFQVCSICNGKLNNGLCSQHGDAATSNEMILSFVLDDSTGDLRCVSFRDVAEKVCDITAKELSEMEPEKKYNMIKGKILGKEVTLIGRVRKNTVYDRLEMTVNDIKAINALEEINRLVGDIELMVGG